MLAVQHIGQLQQRAARRFVDRAVHRDRRQRIATLREPRLVVLGDVHAAFAQQRAHAPDHARHVLIGEDEQRVLAGSRPRGRSRCA